MIVIIIIIIFVILPTMVQSIIIIVVIGMNANAITFCAHRLHHEGLQASRLPAASIVAAQDDVYSPPVPSEKDIRVEDVASDEVFGSSSRTSLQRRLYPESVWPFLSASKNHRHFRALISSAGAFSQS